MKAALVSSFAEPPRYTDTNAPKPSAEEVLVEVRAAALSQLTRAQAAGKHYSGATPPLVPGTDGVGLLEDGRRVYFAFPRAPHGSMAERCVVSREYVIDVPATLDDVTIAAIANPGMSSWAGLQRARFKAGECVLVNGATGTSGRLAVQIAKHLGAPRVIATGRTQRKLEPLLELGADVILALEQDATKLRAALRAELEAGVDVVLDYLWGTPAERVLQAFSGYGVDAGARPVRFVQIGAMAGELVQLSPTPLRSAPIELLGSGLGSTSKKRLMEAIANMLQAVQPGQLRIDAEAMPLADVEAAWTRPSDARIVFTL